MKIDVNELFEELGSLSQVEAIALGGSRSVLFRIIGKWNSPLVVAAAT